MNDLVLGQQLFLYTKLEEYIVRGAMRDIADNVITQREGEQVLRLGRLQANVPGLFNKYLKPEGDEMLKQIVLFKNREKIIPLEEVKAQCEAFTQSFGLVAFDQKVNKLVALRRCIKTAPETLHAQLVKFQGAPMFVALSNETTGIDKVQPFHLLGDEKSPQLLCFIQGDVSCLDQLRKKIVRDMKSHDTFEALWKNYTTDTDEGNEDYIGHEIAALVPPSTCILLVSDQAGQSQSFEHSDANIETEHEWGWSYGQDKPATGGETVDKPAAAASEDSDNPFGDMGGDATITKDTLETAATAVVEDKKERVKRQLPAGVPIARLKKGEINGYKKKNIINGNGVFQFKDNYEPFVRCPELNADGSKVSKEENHKWHLDHIGIIPENWDQKPLFPASALIIEMRINLKTIKDTVSAAAVAVAEPKSMALSQSKIDSFKATILPKLLGNNQETIANPDGILAHEKSIKPVWVGLGYESPFQMLYPHLARLHIATEDPELATHMWGNWQRKAIELHQENEKLKALLETATKPKEEAAFGNM